KKRPFNLSPNAVSASNAPACRSLISKEARMSRVNAKPIIVFDLDGTLVETAPDLLDSLNHCLSISGLETADPVSLRRFVGQGGRVMIERAFAVQQKHVDDVMLDHLVEEFRTHYAANIPGQSVFFPGVLDALDRFATNGY